MLKMKHMIYQLMFQIHVIKRNEKKGLSKIKTFNYAVSNYKAIEQYLVIHVSRYILSLKS
jgi:hypothetical protein